MPLIPPNPSIVEEPRSGNGPPSSIIIVGSGVFGLTTALSLSHRPAYASTTITVIDKSPFPAADGSSIDSSRIIRADYKDPVYARLAAEALEIWRLPGSHDDDGSSARGANGSSARIYAGVGAENRYSESGLVLVGDGDVEYVTESYKNMKAQADVLEVGESVKYLDGKDDIRAAMKTGGVTGSRGYINPFSGWADAQAAMVWVREQCEKRENIKFLEGEVEMLWVKKNSETDDEGVKVGEKKVEGVVMKNGNMLSADITVLAAGAWSPGLLDLAGRAVATGQVMAYVEVSEEEEAQLKDIPVTLDLSNGMFIFPPKAGVMKIARHAFGYVNSMEGEGWEKAGEGVVVSRPVTGVSLPGVRIPKDDEDMLAKGLAEMVPSLKGREFKKTRLCWYTDTPTGDFIVSYHPTINRLFLATGGSGHAFKFLPVLGEKVADGIEGKLEADLVKLWNIRDPVEGPVVTHDGSRNGAERAELSGVLRIDA
ncbi:hypothetical protein TWF703_008322 [Orbilia oligospora]|uniref:FAD dependent oxidoreductase domain-containing protein n=1 Tax=Orbilia oligospora TaxID=2813651 RepID=A0A7C8JKX1_ORBOL|nr:hypothetical protein TWF703_008322 [Orbilia oligospora]